MKTLAILVGGGPAPGINAVIAAATIEARNRGLRVLGCEDGFKWLMLGDLSRVHELDIGALPVVADANRVVGMLTATDVMQYIVSAPARGRTRQVQRPRPR